jgi:hypothetical protein
MEVKDASRVATARVNRATNTEVKDVSKVATARVNRATNMEVKDASRVATAVVRTSTPLADSTNSRETMVELVTTRTGGIMIVSFMSFHFWNHLRVVYFPTCLLSKTTSYAQFQSNPLAYRR